jgi:hypothetical protein
MLMSVLELLVWFDPFVLPFHLFVTGHILTGAVGLVALWIPVLGRKGGQAHRVVGRVFVVSMLLTGSLAIGMSTCTIVDPTGTHPHIHDMAPELIRGIFGWMMLYLAVLTINLAWYGYQCIRNRRNHAANRGPFNLALQGILLVASVNCVFHGLALQQPLMLGISTIGFATVVTNLWFLVGPGPGPVAWIKEHLKGLVGAGISVYTAFFAFGAVRLMPELALNPGLWAIPLVVGLSIILYHWRDLTIKYKARVRGAGDGPAVQAAAVQPPRDRSAADLALPGRS